VGSRGKSHATDVVVDRDLDRQDIIVVFDFSFLVPSHVVDGRAGDVFIAATMNIVGNTGSRIGDEVSHGSVGIGDCGPSELKLGDGKGLTFFFHDLVNRDDLVVFTLCVEKKK
jgi:hypothetical protein